MYFMMMCLSPDDEDHAVLQHKRDHPFRSWHSGNPFRSDAGKSYKRPPAEPVVARIEAGDEGAMAELWDNPVPLMTRALHERLVAAGVDNLDVYQAEIREERTGEVHSDYVAFNLIGKVSAADLMASNDTDSEPPTRGRGPMLFRLAEAVNAIVVHEKVKTALEAAGIDTLTFLPPGQWGT